MSITRRWLRRCALVALLWFAWFFLFPHSQSLRELAEHPGRFHRRMVRLSGHLADGGDPSQYILLVRDPLGREITVFIQATAHTLTTRRTAARLRSLAGTYIRMPGTTREQSVVRWRELPANVVGFLHYSHKACFSSGLSISASYIAVTSDAYFENGFVLPPKRLRTGAR